MRSLLKCLDSVDATAIDHLEEDALLHTWMAGSWGPQKVRVAVGKRQLGRTF